MCRYLKTNFIACVLSQVTINERVLRFKLNEWTSCFYWPADVFLHGQFPCPFVVQPSSVLTDMESKAIAFSEVRTEIFIHGVPHHFTTWVFSADCSGIIPHKNNST